MLAALTLPAIPAPRAPRRATPRSADDLCRVLRQSQGEPLELDATALDRVLRLDAARNLVEVQAGASWAALAAYLRPVAGDPAGLAALPGSVGSAVDANAPGPAGLPLVAHVDGLALVTADGELRRASRQANENLFQLVIGGQGVFGALYSVTLRVDSLASGAAESAQPAVLRLPAAGGGRRSLGLLVPPERAEPFLGEVRARCADWRVAIEAVQVRRTFAESETFLRWASREYAAIELSLAEPQRFGGTVRALQLCRELIDAAIACGGSYPIACTPEATGAQAEACYPKLKAFLAEKRRHDPAERLQNAWYRHHRGLLGRESCDVRWAA